ncbi:hypothetical protein IHE56_00655 [Streptomyces sp. ID01-12c]|nr:hypothetical protein [Streptomyces caniscabiei]
MNEHKPWCCDGYAAFCPLCPRPTELVRCLGHAYTDGNRETVRISQLHARHAHPDFEYRITNGPRKQWDASNVPPTGENGIPEPGWERNVDRGIDGWERFDYHEETYWRRPKRKTGGPCARPECGGELHTDPWGTPVQCPHSEPAAADTGRRCPRCDCPDGHEQCDHCKTCPHGRPTETAEFAPVSEGPPCAEVPGCDGKCCNTRNKDEELRHANEAIERLTAELDEARAAIARVRDFCSSDQNTPGLGYLRRSKDILAILDQQEAP